MKTLFSLSAILFAAVVGFAGMNSQPSATVVRASATADRQTAAGLYTTYCVKCHGTDGKGQTPQGKATGAQDFTSARWKSRTSLEDAAATVRDGYQDMPSYKKRLTAAQIQSLAQYVKSFPH
jgi:mono/diheme cytochrome c family protein